MRRRGWLTAALAGQEQGGHRQGSFARPGQRPPGCEVPGRLVRPPEQPEGDRLPDEGHDLGFRQCAGHDLRGVAVTLDAGHVSRETLLAQHGTDPLATIQRNASATYNLIAWGAPRQLLNGAKVVSSEFRQEYTCSLPLERRLAPVPEPLAKTGKRLPNWCQAGLWSCSARDGPDAGPRPLAVRPDCLEASRSAEHRALLRLGSPPATPGLSAHGESCNWRPPTESSGLPPQRSAPETRARPPP